MPADERTTSRLPQPQQGRLALRVLLAEDNRVNRMLAERLLKKQNYEVTSVVNGKLAVEAFLEDLVETTPSTRTLLIVNFRPDRALVLGATYEVVVAAGGMHDVSGNPITEEFRSRFTTRQGGYRVRGRDSRPRTRTRGRRLDRLGDRPRPR